MPKLNPRFMPALAIASLAICGLTLYAAKDAMQGGIDPAAYLRPLQGDQKILHALNRLSFGPAPGDQDAVKKLGLDKWIDQQLHPDRIPENPALSAHLASLETLRMSSAEVATKYTPPAVVQVVLQARQAQQASLPSADPSQSSDQQMTPPAPQQAKQAKPLANALKQNANKQKSGQGARDPRPQQRTLAAMDPVERHTLLATRNPGQIVASDLTEAKLYRAIYSNRQLEEEMVDFWFNHFNVDITKGADRVLTTAYERDAIRPHVFGKFRDLLQATAQSPAMLFYLDNWQSASPDRAAQPQPNAQQRRALEGGFGPVVRARAQQQQQQRVAQARLKQLKAKQQTRGLNENYARELMELHTLGVDNENKPGGYTQQDVINVARAFTGWTIQQPRAGGDFSYNDRIHDNGEKIVLGVTIPAGGGKEDAEKVLDILAKHPATAHFISLKLARRFVSDNPPEALVDRMAKRFHDTDGDIREVMKAMISSPEFFSEGAWKAKVKTPLELVVSAARATNAEVGYAIPLSTHLVDLGEPLYRKQEPTGYSTAAEEWVNSAALLARMNFALELSSGKLPGSAVAVRTNLIENQDDETSANGAIDPSTLLPMMTHRYLFAEPSAQTLSSIQKALADKTPTPELVAGLVLGSPEFQRR